MKKKNLCRRSPQQTTLKGKKGFCSFQVEIYICLLKISAESFRINIFPISLLQFKTAIIHELKCNCIYTGPQYPMEKIRMKNSV